MWDSARMLGRAMAGSGRQERRQGWWFGATKSKKIIKTKFAVLCTRIKPHT